MKLRFNFNGKVEDFLACLRVEILEEKRSKNMWLNNLSVPRSKNFIGLVNETDCSFVFEPLIYLSRFPMVLAKGRVVLHDDNSQEVVTTVGAPTALLWMFGGGTFFGISIFYINIQFFGFEIPIDDVKFRTAVVLGLFSIGSIAIHRFSSEKRRCVRYIKNCIEKASIKNEEHTCPPRATSHCMEM
jgi:hypothetical protein